MQKNFREHFSKFTEMIRNNKHFAFARYSDGELFILQNKELKLDADVIQVADAITPGVYQAPDFKHYDPKEHGFYQQKLTGKQIIEIAKLAQKIEEHYNMPMDIEFAIEDNTVYIVQARPITTL